MTTNARPTANLASHFYLRDGSPFYEVPYADKKKAGAMRKATIADARKVGALPSVTTILRVLDKPGLNAWRVEQAVLAVLTSPQQPGESVDDFVKRILQTEEQQEQEGAKARDIGIEIHDAIEAILSDEPANPSVRDFVVPALALLNEKIPGMTNAITETVVVGNGYAGRIDLLTDTTDAIWIVDFKTTKKLPPKEPWNEHKLQLSAYATAETRKKQPGDNRPIRTANLYIDTLNPGKLAWFEVEDWNKIYHAAFLPLIDVWCWMNNYQS